MGAGSPVPSFLLNQNIVKVAILKITGVALLALVGLVSCNIKEDMSDCPGYILLDYSDYADEILDEIDPESVVSLFVFDADDICSDIVSFKYSELEECGFSFEVPMEFNGRRAVVWHGYTDDDYTTIFGKGVKFADFELNLDIERGGTFGHMPDELWSCEAEPIDFCAAITRHRIHMIRLHTEVNLNLRRTNSRDLSLVEEVDMGDYLVSIDVANDKYRSDVDLSGDCVEVSYTNSEQLTTEEELDEAQVGALRIVVDKSCTLAVTDTQSGELVSIGGSKEMDLLSYMLQSKSDSEMENQRFLDLNKIWDIDLLIDDANVAICLNINGWTVWFDDVDLK